jgi:hypothetical protein
MSQSLFISMLFPTLSEVKPEDIPMSVINLTIHGLDYYTNVADEFQIPPFQKIFDQKLNVLNIYTQAGNVAKALKLDNTEAFKKFNGDCKKYVESVSKEADFSDYEIGWIRQQVFDFDKGQFENSLEDVISHNRMLCEANGYFDNPDIQKMFVTVLAYLSKTYGEKTIGSVDAVLGGKSVSPTTSTSSGGSTTSTSSGGSTTSTSSGGSTTSTSSGGASLPETSNTSSSGSLIVSALVLGGLGLTAVYLYKKTRKK